MSILTFLLLVGAIVGAALFYDKQKNPDSPIVASLRKAFTNKTAGTFLIWAGGLMIISLLIGWSVYVDPPSRMSSYKTILFIEIMLIIAFVACLIMVGVKLNDLEKKLNKPS